MGNEDNIIVLKSETKNNVVKLSNRTETHAAIIGENYVKIFGTVNGKVYSKNFKIGDLAEYSSDWNGSLYGKIKRIYNDRVLIVENGVIHVLLMYEFARHNFDFDASQIKL